MGGCALIVWGRHMSAKINEENFVRYGAILQWEQINQAVVNANVKKQSQIGIVGHLGEITLYTEWATARMTSPFCVEHSSKRSEREK